MLFVKKRKLGILHQMILDFAPLYSQMSQYFAIIKARAGQIRRVQ